MQVGHIEVVNKQYVKVFPADGVNSSEVVRKKKQNFFQKFRFPSEWKEVKCFCSGKFCFCVSELSVVQHWQRGLI